MIKRLVGYLTSGPAILSLFLILGCSGGNSGEDAFKDPEPETQWVVRSYNEKCGLCHRTGSIADVETLHTESDETEGIAGSIESVSIDNNTGLVIVNFELFDSGNSLIPISGVSGSNIRFTLAKLVPGANGNADMWVSYINSTETIGADTPGNMPDGTAVTAGSSRVQATSERASDRDEVFSDNGDGSYSYRFSFDIKNITDPVAVPYDASLTHRIAMQVSGNTANAYLDFVPNGNPISDTRDIVINASCNACHLKLGFHGGDRIQIAYCVTCHNPGTTDANSGNTMDLNVLIHKIHMGETLPSIDKLGWEYTVWGHRDSKHDYSGVVFPMDARFPGLGTAETTCGTCHSTGDATDSDNWNMVPTIEACTSCHDTVSFDGTIPDGFSAHSGGVQADNGSCAVCHPATGAPPGVGISVVAAHTMPDQVAARTFSFNIIGVTDDESGPVDPGDYARITFSVTDPTSADAPWDLLNDPPFTGGRMSLLLGWDTKDIHNTGSESGPAQPVSIGLDTLVDNLDGTFSVTSRTPLPEDLEGNAIVAIQGRLAGDFDGDGTYSDRVAPTSVAMSFPVGNAEAVYRREVVNIDKCNACHGRLSLHGGNRTDSILVCALCHNADATDYEVRPEDSATTVDGKVEESIDFKYMIHAIHAGSADAHGYRETGIVVYGYHSSINDYSHVALPAGTDNLRYCFGCHNNGAFALPLNEDVLPTTILTKTELDNPDDDVNITPMTAVCASCHDGIEAKTHMSEYGGVFDFVAFVEETVTEDSEENSQAALCGPGDISELPGGHTSRSDCCSCHSAN